MASTTREHRPTAERRAQLLDAAVAVMRDGGIQAATTRAVADRAGLPQGAFHYCFRSKDEMFSALLERELDASLGNAWEAVAHTRDLETGIAAALRAILDRVRSDPEYHLLTAELVDVAARTPELAHIASREHTAYVDQTDRILRQWQESVGTPLSVDSQLLAQVLVAASSGITSAWLSARDDEAAHESIALLSSALAVKAAQQDLRA
ncbi:TetR family transcriptional regulator [Tamaricihabitans halophyticus]|uniref:TetR family transcriptional regulator n=1 Tax=Tamaricihabitans halophyticus TaxID=1262583 RepID=A0A4R2PYC8_9PSEU|nr:TetR/AcrR family transcriptional regulator [Tamaricihabitans halophyticus]TCP41253.1 TetR family transcriptional regulator [Tamaricihabitans halophyticus]